MASGFWFNIGGETSVNVTLNEDGSLTLMAGTPDIGGLRASLCMMTAEELGVGIEHIRTIIGDTSSLGYNFVTGGSRSTFSSGMAAVEATRSVKKQIIQRAAKLWELPEDAVDFEDGFVKPALFRVLARFVFGLAGAVVQQGMTVLAHNGATLARLPRQRLTKRAQNLRRLLRLKPPNPLKNKEEIN